jgi:hypothetical protein
MSLFYIATGTPEMVFYARASARSGTAATILTMVMFPTRGAARDRCEQRVT